MLGGDLERIVPATDEEAVSLADVRHLGTGDRLERFSPSKPHWESDQMPVDPEFMPQLALMREQPATDYANTPVELPAEYDAVVGAIFDRIKA